MQITQENLFSYMQSWLRECDMKILGYHNDTKAQKAKQCFCESLHLLEFLDTFSYDLVYGSKEFFLAVAKKSQKDLGVDECEFEALLQDSISQLDKLTKLRKARIDFATQYRIRWHTANPRLLLERFRDFNIEIEARKKRGQNDFNPLLRFFFFFDYNTHILKF